MLKFNIEKKSNFEEFIFVYNNYKNIHFFNTCLHPTHYLLFLLAKSIIFKITNNSSKINLQSYHNIENRNQFKTIKDYVLLPGVIPITKEISQITGININVDHFD
jgi:phage terminase large subunit